MDDDIVKITLAGDDLQKNAVDHEHQKAHRDIDDRDAEEHADTVDPAQGGFEDPIFSAEHGDQHGDQRRDLAERDDDPEEQRQQIRETAPLTLEHDDSVTDEEDRHDQQRYEDRDHHHDQNGFLMLAGKERQRKDGACQREKQKITVAVSASVIDKRDDQQRPEEDHCRTNND